MPSALLSVSPFRRQLLERLREPASATQLAADLEVGRQRVNYHLRELERAGLVELVEERRRRGCVERVLRARAATQDRHAAEHLIVTAGDVVRDVSRMQEAAAEAGRRLLTFTIETEVRFAQPEEIEQFGEALAAAVAQVAAGFGASAGRPYRVVAGGYPAPAGEGKTA